MLTLTLDSIRPPVLMLATPVIPSSWFISVSSTNVETSSVVASFLSTAAIAIGIMFGLIFMIYGEPISSSHEPSTRSTPCMVLTMAVFMSAPFSNSRTTSE